MTADVAGARELKSLSKEGRFFGELMEVLMRRILVATDGSDGANRAVDAAADLAGKLKLELWILTVMDGFFNEALELSRKERIDLGDAIDAVTNGMLAAAKERAQKRGAEELHVTSIAGDTTERILETAQRVGADTIFIGRRGRGRLQGLLLGSVSQKVASLAPCMVVIVP